MKRLFAIFVALCAAFVAVAQSENSIIIDQNTFRPVQTDPLTKVNIDPIAIDSSRRPCARIKVKINRMSREDIDKIEVKIHSNNQLTKCKTADYENGLILEMTAKTATRFYLDHPEFGQSNEVTFNIDPNKEYYMEASLNQTYSIIVNSNVADAEVYLDNVLKGRTGDNLSCTISDVMIGSHMLKITYGKVSHEQSIEVNKNSISFRQNVNTAASEPQFVVFAVEPATAVVTIDGTPYSLQEGSVMTVLESGTYNYVVAAAGYNSQSGTFTVAGQKVEKVVTLTADAAKVVLTAPADAEIWINGSKKGSGSWNGTLNSGVYIFEARKVGHRSAIMSQKITSDNPTQRYILPAPTPIVGSVSVASTPLMADVTIDGKVVGRTPLELNDILVGEHTIEISKNGYRTYSQTVVVAEGKSVKINTELVKGVGSVIVLHTPQPGYKVGDLVIVNGVKGVVFQINDYQKTFKIMSVTKSGEYWSEKKIITGATDEYNGAKNMAKIKAIDSWETLFPAFKWCADIGEGWYFPAIKEVNSCYGSIAYKTLTDNGFEKLGAKGWVGSSTEIRKAKFYCYSRTLGCTTDMKKDYLSTTIRAVRVVDESKDDIIRITKSIPITIDKSLDVYRLNSLGYEYHQKKNYNTAVQYFYVAAENGSAYAQNYMGIYYEYGYCVTKNYAEAVYWYRKASEQGNSYAQDNLGHCYEVGYGVTKDTAEAVKWYRKSAEQGNSRAQCNLGNCYENGRGVTQNYTEAVKWYRKSAEQGYEWGQYHLGYCYNRGDNITEAVKWYRKAAEQGNKLAKDRLRNLGY